ncbi:MAG: ATP-binding cassette domain-containing protein, partial [Selenomonadaceae bacterium]|nr:ATP-binding cassette domain-containing protein [Selenomonadaceae bacterium]
MCKVDIGSEVLDIVCGAPNARKGIKVIVAQVGAELPGDFKIKKGEVNGFTGLLGSGRSESVRAIFAADRVTSGSVKMNDKEVKIQKPKDAMKNGIGYLPEDRKGDGI